MKIKSSFLILCFFTLALTAFAQSANTKAKIESLEKALKDNTDLRTKLGKTAYDKSDTARVDILLRLYSKLSDDNQTEYAEKILVEAQLIIQKIGYKKGEANLCIPVGWNFFLQGNYDEAIKLFRKCLNISKEIGHKKGVANALTNMATVYNYRGNYPEALKIHFEGLKIMEQMNHELGAATCYQNIAGVYDNLKNFEEAIRYDLKALKIQEKFGDKKSMMSCYINLGAHSYSKKSFSQALQYYFEAIKISNSINEHSSDANLFEDISITYYEMGDYVEAKKYNALALKLANELNDITSIPSFLVNASKLSKVDNDFAMARTYLDSALVLSKRLGSNDLLRDTYMELENLDSTMGKWQSAYLHHKQYVIYRDSVINAANTEKIVKTEMQYEFDKKEAATKAEQEKKDLAHEKELALRAIQFEYQQKQAAAKSEKEKQQLRFDQQLKEQKIELEYNQKIATAETERKNQQTLNKVLSSENQLMAKNNENERKIRWLMIAALLGLVGFGVNYYRNYQRQRADNQVIVKQSGELQVLMQEIHHRVKNNLQLISSLLELQSLKLTDSAAKSAFEEGQSRVQSIAILHQQLYQHDDLSVIELGTFSKELIRQITDVFKKPKQKIQVKYHIPETFFDIDTALPLGLILNELATNSFKYAHPATDSEGVEALALEISFSKNNDGNYALVYKDNGKGLPTGFDLVKSNSLGLRIVNRLVKQIKGQYQYTFDKGSVFTITFPSA